MQIFAFGIEEAAWNGPERRRRGAGALGSERRMIEPLAGSSASGVLWLSDLLEHASGTSAPTAAGSATGIAAAMSAALVAMAAERSRGSWAGAGGAIAQAGTLQQRCLELAHADVEAFGRAAAALERGTGVEEPLRETVDLLLALGESACDIAELSAWLGPHSLPLHLRSGDAGLTAVVVDGPRGTVALGRPGAS